MNKFIDKLRLLRKQRRILRAQAFRPMATRTTKNSTERMRGREVVVCEECESRHVAHEPTGVSDYWMLRCESCGWEQVT